MGEAEQGAEHSRRAVGDSWGSRQVAPLTTGFTEDLGQCILLFGAFCNGNMGDVLQHISMRHILESVAPEGQCFYYGHSGGENFSKGFRIGEFFGGDRSKLVPFFTDSANEVNNFKAIVIGGGGIFSAKHAPLFKDEFAEAITVPIIVMGVGANFYAKEYGALLGKAAFVSGRDDTSTTRFTSVLKACGDPMVKPEDVRLVRDPVLSDEAFTDTDGDCWKQSKGGRGEPYCFVLPAADNANNVEMHRLFRTQMVEVGDRFINVFPKHQVEIAKIGYPGVIEEILDPAEFTEKLCSCKAIITTRFHGAILGLHMGVPTFGAYHHSTENKVPDLMIKTMAMPDQFLLVNQNMTRDVLDQEVATVRRLYEKEGRRDAIHAQLAQFSEEFQVEARNVLAGILGIEGTKLPQHLERQKTSTVFAWLRLLLASSEDYIVVLLLLFGIVGLAVLPSFEKGSGNRRQPSSEDDDSKRVKEVGANGAQGASMGRSRVQKDMDLHSPETTISSLDSTYKGSEQGLLEEQSMATPSKPSSRAPSHWALWEGVKTASREIRLSNVIFALNFSLWVALAVTYSSYSKFYLRRTHDPVGLLVLQGTTGAVVLFSLGCFGLGGSAVGLPCLAAQPTSSSQRAMLAAALHASQALLTNFSLLVGGVALTNALKAMEPVAAAVFSYFLLGKTASTASVVSFATIVVGILLLTSKSDGGGSSKAERGAGAELVGEGGHYSRILVSAVFTVAAVSCNALRNVLIKKSDPVPPRQTLFSCSVAAGVVGIALMLVRLMMRSMEDVLQQENTAASMVSAGGVQSTGEVGVAHAVGENEYGSWLSMDGLKAALCFVGYNFASFNLLARLSPVGHAVGNSVKRVVMFASGMFFLGEVLTSRQLTGAAVALSGVLIYNMSRTRQS